MGRKKLPIGIQTFREIREDDCYYVDKTGFAQSLVDGGKTYFLSRPRRFGKSLFLDTLAEMFAGNKTLFEGLACYDTWDWDTVYPVVRISFAEGVIADTDQLDRHVRGQLVDNAERLGIEAAPDQDVARVLSLLIRRAEQAHGQRVVVLVDEYDKPILDSFTDLEVARQMRDSLRGLYSVLKGQDAHIKFVLLTGVSKFSKVNIFSGLNNLEDITLVPAYSALCGYTDEDVDTVFAPELDGLDRDQIRYWYNGYNWTGETVYNPFDLLLLFKHRQLRPYWFETGTPTFLLDTLTDRQVYLPTLGDLEASDAALSAFEVGDVSTPALLFQSGYLTIAATRRIGAVVQYRMKYPNQEVRSSLTEAMLGRLRPADRQPPGTDRFTLYDRLVAGDLAGVDTFMRTVFSAIPADWHRKNPIDRFEGYYASVFYACFASLPVDVTTEDASSTGRLDMAVHVADRTYLFEFKTVDHSPTGKALQQIRDKRYADKYRDDGTTIHLVGIEFSQEQRNIVAFDTETYS
ncbi:MAG: ATP-binding protein [Micrococcales bacterium]|nr:ATP-binding protein [Micrococcales bacterium]